MIDFLAASGASLEITIDIQASKPDGFTDAEMRTIKENASVLRFDASCGFEGRKEHGLGAHIAPSPSCS